MENIITIPMREYRELVECAIRVKVFGKYVHSEKYAIDREMCGLFLDFEVSDNE